MRLSVPTSMKRNAQYQMLLLVMSASRNAWNW